MPRTKEELDDRFQNQPWFIKLWRYRYYLRIPFHAIESWIRYQLYETPEDKKKYPLSFRNIWSIQIGLAQGPMRWYYTWEEIVAGHPDCRDEDVELMEDIEEEKDE
jgi:hypothetical protein